MQGGCLGNRLPRNTTACASKTTTASQASQWAGPCQRHTQAIQTNLHIPDRTPWWTTPGPPTFLLTGLPSQTPISTFQAVVPSEKAPGNCCTWGNQSECKHCISCSMAGPAQVRWPSSAFAPFAAALWLCAACPFACCCADCSWPAMDWPVDRSPSAAMALEWVREGGPELGDWGDKRMMARSNRCR